MYREILTVLSALYPLSHLIYKQLMRWVPMLSPFHQQGRRDSEKFSNLYKATKPEVTELGFVPRAKAISHYSRMCLE